MPYPTMATRKKGISPIAIDNLIIRLVPFFRLNAIGKIRLPQLTDWMRPINLLAVLT
jgi:hypothetical protein